MAIESGGMFQGYLWRQLDLFAFHAVALVDLKPGVVLDADNEGGTGDAGTAIVVGGKLVHRS